MTRLIEPVEGVSALLETMESKKRARARLDEVVIGFIGSMVEGEVVISERCRLSDGPTVDERMVGRAGGRREEGETSIEA